MGNATPERTNTACKNRISRDRFPATGIVALDGGMISRDDFQVAITEWEHLKKTEPGVSFEDVLVHKGLITPEVMMKLIPATIRKMSVEFGDIAVEKGWISRSYADKALRVQAEKFKNGELMLLSDLLIRAGLFTEEKRDAIYHVQNEKSIDWFLSNTGKSRYPDPKKESEALKKEIQYERTLGELAVAYGFITHEQLEKGIGLLKKAMKKGIRISLTRILTETGALQTEDKKTLAKLKYFLKIRDLDTKFAAIAIQKDYLDKSVAKAGLASQQAAFDTDRKMVTLAEILISKQQMTLDSAVEILQLQERDLPAPLLENAKTRALQETVPEETEFASSEIIINIESDCLAAEVIVPPQYPGPISPDDIRKLLEERNVVSGIIPDSQIIEALDGDVAHVRRFAVAKGTPATPGTDGKLTLNFPREYLNPGTETEDGKMDFQDRGAVPFVAKGDILAEIIPEKHGIPGKDIYGAEIPSPPVTPVTASAGPGTKMIDNGLKIISDEEGQPVIAINGEISVVKEFLVKGDVDFTTGNINFNGHITVKGSVKEGFQVRGGSLTTGSIDGGTIVLTGNLEVSSGIVDASIQTEGNIQAMYVAGSKIESYGDVIIKREILDSDIKTSGACNCEKATFVASEISALQGVNALRIGTDVSEPCVFRVGTDAHTEVIISGLKEKIAKWKTLLEEKQKEVEDFEKEHRETTEMITEVAQTQEAAQLRLREMEEGAPGDNTDEKTRLKNIVTETETTISGYFDQQEILMNKADASREVCGDFVKRIENLSTEIHEIKNWLKKQNRMAKVHSEKEIQPGTVVFGPGTMLVVKEMVRKCSIVETAGNPTEDERSWVMKIIPD